MASVELGIKGTQFVVNDVPTFLYGISYYGALGASEETVRQDLAEAKLHGFNWIRVWATWAAFDNDVSAVDTEGRPREPYLGKLKWLVMACDREGMVVDVTLSRGNGATGPARLQTPEAHRQAVETIVGALKACRNWYLDLSNERNIDDPRHTSFTDLERLRQVVHMLDPERLVTASHAGDISRGDLREYIDEVEVDFIAPHRPRHARSAAETEAKTREYLAWMQDLAHVVPVHYQEPFRRGFGGWEPSASDFVADARGALAGGAAGWCLHNGHTTNAPEGEPRRSFDLRARRLFEQLDPEERRALAELDPLFAAKPPITAMPRPAQAPAYAPQTRVSMLNAKWYLNEHPTYPGAPAEGLLMNVRMVNALFEDAHRPEFDPEANTCQFVVRIPEYVAQGVRAFTISLQGGMPGYEGALNSAFNPDGSLRESYLRRARSIIEACDRHGAAVILSCFYQRQDQFLTDEAAVRDGVVNVAQWIQACGFTNVLLEIANEFPHAGYEHKILRTPEGEAQLIRLAHEAAPGLLVSTSGVGDGRYPEAVARAADFILIHFNDTPVAQIPQRVAALKPLGKPIVCNEDDKVGEEGARAAEASVAGGASWGFMHAKRNQYFPLTFNGAADDPVVYAKLKELTAPE